MSWTKDRGRMFAKKVIATAIENAARVQRSKDGHLKAAWAVDRVRTELQRMGYCVSLPDHVCKNGPDLIIKTTGHQAFAFVEVKLAMWNKRGWRVNRVTRKDDDYIAIVFPEGRVHFEAMKDHLVLCNASGDRWIMALGRLLG